MFFTVSYIYICCSSLCTAVQEERTPHGPILQQATTPAPLSYFSPNFPKQRSKSTDRPTSPFPQTPSHTTSRIYTSLPNLKTESNDNSKIPPTQTDALMSDIVNADVQSNSQARLLKTKVQDIKMNDFFEGMNTAGVIELAKRIPAFVSLSLNDQVKLLKSSWCEHCTLKLAAQNGPKAECVLLANGVSCNRDQIEDSEVCYIIEKIFTELSYWINDMNMDKVEMASLQGLILFNPGMQQIRTHVFCSATTLCTCVLFQLTEHLPLYYIYPLFTALQMPKV